MVGGGGTTGGTGVGVSTLVLGNLALIGIDATTIGAGGGGASDPASIRTQVRSAFPQLGEVYVTTDPTMVYRIARVSGDIQTGMSAERHLTEMFAIARSLTARGVTIGAGGGGTTGGASR